MDKNCSSIADRGHVEQTSINVDGHDFEINTDFEILPKKPHQICRPNQVANVNSTPSSDEICSNVCVASLIVCVSVCMAEKWSLNTQLNNMPSKRMRILSHVEYFFISSVS